MTQWSFQGFICSFLWSLYFTLPAFLVKFYRFIFPSLSYVLMLAAICCLPDCFPVIVLQVYFSFCAYSFPKFFVFGAHHSYAYLATPPMYSASVHRMCLNTWAAQVRCHALLWVLQILFVYRSVPKQYPAHPTYTISHTHTQHPELTEITRRCQTDSNLHTLPGWLITVPYIRQHMKDPPKTTLDIFWLRYIEAQCEYDNFALEKTKEKCSFDV